MSKSTIIAVIMVVLFLVSPIFLIHHYTVSEEKIQGAATVTVALGTILRSNGRNLVKSTFMSAVRTALRTVTRRVVRRLLPLFLGVLLPSFQTSTVKDPKKIEENQENSVLGALIMGVLTLVFSFYCVVYYNGNLDQNSITGGLSLWTVSILAGFSIVLHYACIAWAGLRYGVKTTLRTTFDGILLQAYFTGALSYLPLASDVELDGTVEDKAKCASFTLYSILGVSILLHGIAMLLGWKILEMWAAQLLLYVFVISFPLKPLEGSDVLAHSPMRWALIFTAVLVAFVLNMPESFYAIL